ncbi:MAG: CBS domain-containing protein, partial [Ruminiclostridium sp.]|nr:CBS domain-containing protein [Ruminiclostridium sp.]
MQVSEVMNRNVVTIDPGESVALAARLLSRHNVGSLPVCGPGGRLLGIVTDRDIVLRCVAPEENPSQVPVRS